MNDVEKEFLRGLNGHFFRALSMHPDDLLPETLYHYTSTAGLYGIISTGKLWATNYNFLNDSSELDYGRQLALEVVEQRTSLASGKTRAFLKDVYHDFDTGADAVDFYLTCFCKTPDLLSQWRGYGTPSGRFCLGFNTEELLCGCTVLEHYSGSAVYDRTRQHKKLSLAIDRACKTLEQGRAGSTDFWAGVRQALTKKLVQQVCFFKNSAFQEEAEWRLVHSSGRADSIHFQTTGSMLRPVVDMVTASATESLPITAVILGSSRDSRLVSKAVHLLLERYNYRGVEVRESLVPYRDIGNN